MSSTQLNQGATRVFLAHLFVVASLMTSGFMLSTATELGPMAPLVIAEGFYLAGFALVIEVGLAARALGETALRALARRRGNAEMLEA